MAGIGRKLLKNAMKGVYTRLMDKVGGKVVAGMADTSSDAPDAYYAPKRDKYREMVAEEQAARSAEASEEG
ncbi:MAG TPA: hypothetical protein QGF58_10290 [Myxococcota bacterium]|nr:hypothetical protein [Myxococcota bacterium]